MHYPFIKTFDIIGAIFSFISTIFYIRVNLYAWPFALTAMSINLILYFMTGLYADAGKEIIYWISTVLGWYWWYQGTQQKEKLPITHLSFRHGLILTGIGIFSAVIFIFVLIHYMHSQVPYWDATTAILSLIAHWLICRKIIECWILWFIVDVLYVGLYFYKGLPAHGILFILYTIMAIIGYFYWSTDFRRILIKEDQRTLTN